MSWKPGRPDLICRGEGPDVLSCHISSVPASSLPGQAGEVVGVDLHLSGVVSLLGTGPGCGDPGRNRATVPAPSGCSPSGGRVRPEDHPLIKIQGTNCFGWVLLWGPQSFSGMSGIYDVFLFCCLAQPLPQPSKAGTRPVRWQELLR